MPEDPSANTAPGAPGADRPDDSEDRWKAEYEAQIRALGLTPEPAGARGHAERRRFPRVSFPPGSTIYLHGDPRAHAIHDFSAGGLSFYSDRAIPTGSRILLSAMGQLALQVEVMGCELEEFDPDFLEYRYRVRARFTDEVNGYQAFVLAREIYQQSHTNLHSR
jgi:hypothetical protein